jgi:hypothetical protein
MGLDLIMKKFKIYSCLVLFLAIALNLGSASGQNFYKEKVSRNNFLQAGIGLGALYSDNAGYFGNLDFLLRPGLSISYGQKFHENFDIRANLGYQRTRGQFLDYYPTQILEIWRASDQAISSKNHMLFLDVIPSLYLFGSDNHTKRSKINAYGGIGLGLLMNFKTTINFDLNTNFKTQAVGYVPVKVGTSYRFDLYTDIALEGTVMFTFSDDLDGNVGYNRFNDFPFMGQIVIRRYLDPLKKIY